jgi:hypothetical protein
LVLAAVEIEAGRELEAADFEANITRWRAIAVVDNLNHRFEAIKYMEDARVPRRIHRKAISQSSGRNRPLYIGGSVGSLAVVASGGALALAIAAAFTGGLAGG